MLRYFKYSIPFIRPFKTTAKTFSNREGIILSYKKEGVRAFGEVAPLPGFSSETLQQTELVLQRNKQFLEKSFFDSDARQIISLLDQIHQFPSLNFGLDTLWHDFQSKKEKKTLSEFLFGMKGSPLECNTTIGIQSEKEIFPQIELKIEEGYETFKIKVGTDFKEEKYILENIRKKYPDIKLRIDANQAWSKQTAVDHLNSIEKLDIEYCEQPVPADNIEDLKWVKDRTQIRIAADESLRNKKNAKELIEQNYCDIIIIKPALMGLFENIIVTKELAETHNTEVIFTSSLDGIIGRTASAILASGLGTKKLAHGMATGSLLAEKVSEAESISNGLYSVPDVYGIGNPIDLTLLKEI